MRDLTYRDALEVLDRHGIKLTEPAWKAGKETIRVGTIVSKLEEERDRWEMHFREADAAGVKAVREGRAIIATLESRLAKLEAVAEKLAAALWEFDYNPDSAPRSRGYFCAGCDLEDLDRATSTYHDKCCKAAREALAAFAVLKEPTNG